MSSFRRASFSCQEKLPGVFLLTLRDNNKYLSSEVFLHDNIFVVQIFFPYPVYFVWPNIFSIAQVRLVRQNIVHRASYFFYKCTLVLVFSSRLSSRIQQSIIQSRSTAIFGLWQTLYIPYSQDTTRSLTNEERNRVKKPYFSKNKNWLTNSLFSYFSKTWVLEFI